MYYTSGEVLAIRCASGECLNSGAWTQFTLCTRLQAHCLAEALAPATCKATPKRATLWCLGFSLPCSFHDVESLPQSAGASPSAGPVTALSCAGPLCAPVVRTLDGRAVRRPASSALVSPSTLVDRR